MRYWILVFLFFCGFLAQAQSYSDAWRGFFSYTSIKDVAYGPDRVFVAAENAVYVYNIWTGETTTVTTIQGLSGEPITEIHYSQQYQLLMVGHDNGLIEIIPEDGNQVLQIVAILDKPSIPPKHQGH